MFKWDFDGGPNDDAWTWSCVDSDTGGVIRTSTRVFSTLQQCVLDAVKYRVADVQAYSGLDTPLEEALVSREFLGSLLRRAEGGDQDGQVADIEYRLAEVEGVIAVLTDTTRKH
jgi:hypothetical protein